MGGEIAVMVKRVMVAHDDESAGRPPYPFPLPPSSSSPRFQPARPPPSADPNPKPSSSPTSSSLLQKFMVKYSKVQHRKFSLLYLCVAVCLLVWWRTDDNWGGVAFGLLILHLLLVHCGIIEHGSKTPKAC
ncbi:hypothetical protein E2C01_002419 [Portunus trituberculatus]|uniref:Uncharacterized protein n=1 Tax=Portunus trituberculatus TaxID=210409 RepID=A0A5B7CJB7_PORTR|nr:hypothetical protein [Portunus trituberculatus]